MGWLRFICCRELALIFESRTRLAKLQIASTLELRMPVMLMYLAYASSHVDYHFTRKSSSRNHGRRH